MAVCGSNLLFCDNRYTEGISSTNSYYFSRFLPIWGWATWKRAWDQFDIGMKAWLNFRNNEKFLEYFPNKKVARYFRQCFDETYSGKIETWDYQWYFSCIKSNGLSIIPKNNLVSNIGSEGSHPNSAGLFSNLPLPKLLLEDIHFRVDIQQDKKFDEFIFQLIMMSNKASISDRVANISFKLRHTLNL
jgi:hypothetical protein